MKISKIIKILIATIWILYCVQGIVHNYSHYGFLEWLIIIIITFFPFLISGVLTHKKSHNPNISNKPTKKHEMISEEKIEYVQIPIQQDDSLSVNMPESFSQIPYEVLRLLWIKGKNIVDDEPSMIDISLMTSNIITESDYITGYYPNYKNLSPAQRYIYLKWLEDVRKPIDIGYVFLFYYGLERHLFLGDFDNSYKMIETLRQHHDNHSFQQYSSDALLMSIVYHKRFDLIQNISFDSLDTPVKFYLKHNLNIPITSDDIIDSCRKFGFTNNRYLKENKDLFRELLDKKLYEMYGQPAFKFTDDDFKNVNANCPLVLANYSLTSRIAVMPNITTNTHVANKIFCILSSVHEEYKILKRKNRKTTK